MLRGSAKITQIETFLNQVINEKYMIEHDNQYEDKGRELNGLVKLKRSLMGKLFNMKNKGSSQITGLYDNKSGGKFLEKYVNNDYVISKTDLDDMTAEKIKLVDEKNKLMKKLFNANEKIYNQNTRITQETHNSETLRNVLEVNINSAAKNIQQKKDALNNDIMSQNKLFQIKENEYRKKQYYIYICKHITSFSILSLLTGLFMKTGYIASSTALTLIIIYFILLLIVLGINHLYYSSRNAIYFHRYNWRNKQAEPTPNVSSCEA